MFSLALTFFLVANPIGNSPAIIALVKDFPFERQKHIVLREAIFALIIALFFQYLGEIFLSLLNIKDYAVTITGGLLLLLVAFSMIFVERSPTGESNHRPRAEPYFVPIATPILSGPGLLAIIMMKSKLEQNDLKISLAILLAWAGVIGVLMAAPYMQKLLGKRGLVALEEVMGMIVALIAIEMLVKGMNLFLQTLS